MSNLMAGISIKHGLAERPETLKNKVENRAVVFYTDARRKFRFADGWR
jgi:hypothetical protein